MLTADCFFFIERLALVIAMRCLLNRRCVVRARSVRITPGAARELGNWQMVISHWPSQELPVLWFCLLLCLRFSFLLLISRFSAVFNLGQDFTNALNIFSGPGAKLAAPDFLDWWRRYFLSREITLEGSPIQSQSLGSFASRILSHYVVWYDRLI